jgi:hypothetical protein
MTRHWRVLALTVALTSCGDTDASLGSGSDFPTNTKNPNKPMDEALTGESSLADAESALTIGGAHQMLCDGSLLAPGQARCHAHVRLNGSAQPFAGSTPSNGLAPADLQAAYRVPTGGGAGMTVAIVDAYDNPRAEQDLAVYRMQYNLPPCTTANGCFKKVDQRGGTTYPVANKGWAGEISLDLQMVSAACPSCKLLLVEADSTTTTALGAAVNIAAQLGANAISNSYGATEDNTTTTVDQQYYNHAGIFITASSGDNGFGASFPATSAHVTAVGGTTLRKVTGGRGWTETVWRGAGSGCSRYVAKPSWQADTACTKRMMADVAAVADPATGVNVYESYGSGGWTVFGGTSAAAPLVAGIFAAAGKTEQTAQFSYSNPSDFYDVTSGTNGTCTSAYQCTGGTGYDGPTGNGTPNGAAISGAPGATGGAGGGAGGSSGGTGGGSGSAGSGGTGGGTSGTAGGSSGTAGGSGGTAGGSGGTAGGSGGTAGGAGTGGTGAGPSNMETEPNDTRQTANLLTASVPMIGSISSSTDRDWYRMVVNVGQVVDLKLSDLTADCDLRIYSSTGALLAISDSDGTQTEELRGHVSNSIYYVRVYGWQGATCASYHLTLTVQ